MFVAGVAGSSERTVVHRRRIRRRRNDAADRSKGFATKRRCGMLHTGDAERRTESRTRSRPADGVTDSELVDEEAQEIEARLLNARRQRQQKCRGEFVGSNRCIAERPARSSDCPGRMTRMNSGEMGSGGSGPGDTGASPRQHRIGRVRQHATEVCVCRILRSRLELEPQQPRSCFGRRVEIIPFVWRQCHAR